MLCKFSFTVALSDSTLHNTWCWLFSVSSDHSKSSSLPAAPLPVKSWVFPEILEGWDFFLWISPYAYFILEFTLLAHSIWLKSVLVFKSHLLDTLIPFFFFFVFVNMWLLSFSFGLVIWDLEGISNCVQPSLFNSKAKNML